MFRRWDCLTTLGAAALVSVILVWMQFSFDDNFDTDSWFHTRASQQLAEHGVDRTFEQAAFSTWKDHYSDKDFLYHVLLMPFCAGAEDLRLAGKHAAAWFGVLWVLALALVLLWLRVRAGAVWILLLFSTHSELWEYLMPTRPHVLSLTLLVVEIALLQKGRWKTLVVVSALHVQAHSSFILVPLLVAAFLVAQWIVGQSRQWRLLWACLGGLLLGSVAHPYFPNNWSVSFQQLVDVSSNVWGARSDIPRDLFGPELTPIPAKFFSQGFPGWVPGVLGFLGLLLTHGRRKVRPEVMALALMALGFLVLTFLSARFFAMFVTATTLLGALAWSQWFGEDGWKRLFDQRGGLAWGGLILAALCLLLGQRHSSPWGTRDHVRAGTPNFTAARGVAYLSEHAAPEDQVYHNYWEDFALLYHFRPQGRYVEGLDPVFFHRYDPVLFGRMLEGFRGTAPDLYQIVAEEFGARWIYVATSPRYVPFRRLVRKDTRFALVYEDQWSEVYRVGPETPD